MNLRIYDVSSIWWNENSDIITQRPDSHLLQSRKNKNSAKSLFCPMHVSRLFRRFDSCFPIHPHLIPCPFFYAHRYSLQKSQYLVLPWYSSWKSFLGQQEKRAYTATHMHTSTRYKRSNNLNFRYEERFVSGFSLLFAPNSRKEGFFPFKKYSVSTLTTRYRNQLQILHLTKKKVKGIDFWLFINKFFRISISFLLGLSGVFLAQRRINCFFFVSLYMQFLMCFWLHMYNGISKINVIFWLTQDFKFWF